MSMTSAAHAAYGQCWGEGAARYYSIEGDFLNEEASLKLIPLPDSFICPMTLSVMVDPVATVDGCAYEREYIQTWFRQQRQQRQPITSPATGSQLTSPTLMPLVALQKAIETYMAHRPELRELAINSRSFEEAAGILQHDLFEKQTAHIHLKGELAKFDAQALTDAKEANDKLRAEKDRLEERVRALELEKLATEAHNLQLSNELSWARANLATLEDHVDQLSEQVRSVQQVNEDLRIQLLRRHEEATKEQIPPSDSVLGDTSRTEDDEKVVAVDGKRVALGYLADGAGESRAFFESVSNPFGSLHEKFEKSAVHVTHWLLSRSPLNSNQRQQALSQHQEDLQTTGSGSSIDLDLRTDVGGSVHSTASSSTEPARRRFQDSHGEFRRGQRVALHGVQAKTKLAGSVGRLVRYEVASDRWQVHLLSGSVVKVRPACLRKLPLVSTEETSAHTQTGRWEVLPSMAHQRTGAVAGASDGLVYVCGGGDGSKLLSSAEVYDIRRGLWRALPDLATPRFGAAAAVVGDCLYVCGGGDGRNPVLRSVERFNPQLGRWEALPDMSRKRLGAAAAVLGGRLYICGGRDDLNYLSSVECFDPEQGTWEVLPNMSQQRSGAAAGAVRGCLYVCGGADGQRPILHSAERYDPQSARWEVIPAMSHQCFGATAAVLDGCLYICGGRDGDGCVLKSVERFDSRQGRWQAVPEMTQLRSGAAAAVCDGFLYICGGSDGENTLRSAERLDAR
eukprot:gnl/TRDRNA2_/TRDRNA2_38938_c0_seq1.p1 gnl/TRDRNA2_/TRDRNA2_38938_c0~~gnl/TRDRNA2_/TRDRNA2_38938_c0_seq1.p1  ORF type:complete len:737 (+),score=124.26 gnl/TRDRNA2_/TRDRNA2_38938_c0_seq1:54-2264(+)